MSTPAPSRRPARTRVLVEVLPDAAAVEAPVTALPPEARASALRRLGWTVPLAVAVVALLAQRFVDDLPAWVGVVGAVAVAGTAVGALAAYADQVRTARLARGRAALVAQGVRTTGTVLLRAVTPSDDASTARVEGDLTFSRPVEPGSPAQLTQTVTFAVDAPTASAPALPRVGTREPVAVWFPREIDGEDLVLVRFARPWADDLMDALPDVAG